MKVFFIFLISLLTIAGASYYFVYQTNIALLSDSTLLKIAEEDVLGKHPFNNTCIRSFYVKEVKKVHLSELEGTAIFKFTPLQGKEHECPTFTMKMDRKTAEAWTE